MGQIAWPSPRLELWVSSPFKGLKPTSNNGIAMAIAVTWLSFFSPTARNASKGWRATHKPPAGHSIDLLVIQRRMRGCARRHLGTPGSSRASPPSVSKLGVG